MAIGLQSDHSTLYNSVVIVHYNYRVMGLGESYSHIMAQPHHVAALWSNTCATYGAQVSIVYHIDGSAHTHTHTHTHV